MFKSHDMVYTKTEPGRMHKVYPLAIFIGRDAYDGLLKAAYTAGELGRCHPQRDGMFCKTLF